MDASVKGLDRWQSAAALAEGHCLVLAGPGSGKTTLLAARARYKLDSTPDGALAAVSFTRDSAKELTARIGAGPRLLSGTFHSLALRQCAGLKDSRNIVDEAGRIHYMRRAIRACGLDITLDTAISAIDKLKATLAPPTSGTDMARLFHAYQQALQQHNLRDFQDILLDAVRGMKAGKLQPLPVTWLLVDEAQDMDEIQYAWIKAHVEAGIETTLVADDDQSIYGWRHAMGYYGLTRFEREADAQRLVLEANYRSGEAIVKSAMHVIEYNENRFAKTIHPQRNTTGAVETRAYATQTDEAASIVETVSGNPGQWGILARTNRRLDHIELICSLHSVPFFRLGAGSFWDHAVSSAILAFAKGLTLGDASSGIDRLSVFVDGVSKADIDAVHRGGGKCRTKGLSELVSLTPEWATLVQADRNSLALRALSMWAERALNDRAKAVARPALLHLSHLKGSMKSRLQWIRQKAREAKVRKGDTQVTLASLHASKGLEWPCVWMVGCEDGVLPHVDAPIEEERRLFFVGMTRARDRLMLTHGLDKAAPSRFFAELL